jgi:hypothetical protein
MGQDREHEKGIWDRGIVKKDIAHSKRISLHEPLFDDPRKKKTGRAILTFLGGSGHVSRLSRIR